MSRKHNMLEDLYWKARKYAVRQGRKWDCVDVAAQEDVAGEAYLVLARKTLNRLKGRQITSPQGFASTLAYRTTQNVLRRRAERQRPFESSFLWLDDPDLEPTVDPSDDGAGVERIVQALDGEPPMPEWQRLTRLTYEQLPGDLKRIARAFLKYWHPEDVRRKLRIPARTFYRQMKKLKKVFWPCFIGLERHSRHSAQGSRWQ